MTRNVLWLQPCWQDITINVIWLQHFWQNMAIDVMWPQHFWPGAVWVELLSPTSERFLGVKLACTTYSPFLAARESFFNCRSFAKARPRVSNCLSRISSILQRNLHIEMKQAFSAHGKFMLIIWPFKLSDLCRPGLKHILIKLSSAQH